MVKKKVILDSREVDIPVDTGGSQNLPAPVTGGAVAQFDKDAFDFEKALDVYWGPLKDIFSQEQKEFFYMKAKLYGLNPLKGQCHAQPKKRWLKKWENGKQISYPAVYMDGPMKGKDIYDIAFIVAYTAMIEIAEQQEDYEGAEFQWFYCQADGTLSTNPSGPDNLVLIIATGYKRGLKPIVGQFWLNEFALDNPQWKKMPVHMLTKTIYMRLLTLMYPHKFQGLYEEAETNDQMVYRASDIHEEPAPPARAPKQRVPSQNERDLIRASMTPPAPPTPVEIALSMQNPPVKSPMDILTGGQQGTLPIPPAAPKKEVPVTPKEEPPVEPEAPQTMPEEEVTTDNPQEETYMDPVIALAQAISTNGDIPYQKKDIAGYYSQQQHDLLSSLMKRHFISDFDRTKIYSAMLGVNSDGSPIEIKDNGVVVNYLSVNMAATVTDQYLRYVKEVEEFIKSIIDGWGRDRIKNELKLKLTVVERLIGLVCSDYHRKPQPIVDEHGNPAKTKCFADFKNDIQGYGIKFLTAPQVLEQYKKVEEEISKKKESA